MMPGEIILWRETGVLTPATFLFRRQFPGKHIMVADWGEVSLRMCFNDTVLAPLSCYEH